LSSLYCENNKLTSLDLTNNTKLDTLFCENNQLTSLDLSNNTAVQNLSCFSNQLTSLDISKNSLLVWIRLYVGSQTDSSYNDQMLNLYVNADQLSQTLPNTEENKNVNILLKSGTEATGTHNGFNEIDY